MSPEGALTPPEGMKFIEGYRNKYKGSTFWIIGCDPNLDFYPNNFFEDKLSIAINVSCIAFSSSTFLFTQWKCYADAIRDARPDFLKRMILRFSSSPPAPPSLASWADYGLDPIYTRPFQKPVAYITLRDWEEMAKQIFEGADKVEFITIATSVTIAIGAAAVLGAKRIVLVGCSAKTTKHLFHAQKRGMWLFLHEKPDYEYPADWQSGEEQKWLKPMRTDVDRLAKIFKRYGVELIRHRYDEQEGEFVFEAIKEDLTT